MLKYEPLSVLDWQELARQQQALDDRTAARERLLAFTTHTMSAYQAAEHHIKLANKLDEMVRGTCRRLMVFMPPRSGKSELVSRRLPAYILGRDPEAQIIACSYSADLSSRMNRDVQRIIDGEKYAELFPDTKLYSKFVRQTARGSYLRNTDAFEVVGHSGGYRSAGVGGGITGMGFTFGVIDDPIKNAEEANSPTIREKVWEWYTSAFYTRQDPRHGRILLTLTRWHHDDLAGRLLKLAAEDPEADQWEILCFPALSEDPPVKGDWRTEPGVSIWPERFSVEWLKRTERVLGSRQFAALYQQRPTPEGGNHFKEHWFAPRWLAASLRQPDDGWVLTRRDGSRCEVQRSDSMLFGIVDPAASEKQSADYTALGAFALTPQNDLLILEVVRERLGVEGIAPRLRDLVVKHGLQWVGMEANGFQVAVANQARRLSGMPPVRELSHAGKGKLVRATPAIIRCESGQVFLPSLPEPWVKPFVAECVQFTGLEDAHDDQVDVLAYAGMQAFSKGDGRWVEAEGGDREPSYDSEAGARGLWGRH